ncbi:MAG TPA: DUF84 family protein [Acidobacteriota bacterium]|nr:DUF84 family protein [Acidobacteriota bacterium]
MIVAVGSTRPPKVEAVREAFRRIRECSGWPADEPEVLARDVPHSAPSMPVTVDELVGGAFLRVRALRRDLARRREHADLWIGLEGGLNVLDAPAAKTYTAKGAASEEETASVGAGPATTGAAALRMTSGAAPQKARSAEAGARPISVRQVFLESWVYVEGNRLEGLDQETEAGLPESPEASAAAFGAPRETLDNGRLDSPAGGQLHTSSSVGRALTARQDADDAGGPMVELGRLEGYYARGGGIVVPEALASMVLDQGLELGQAIDAYVGGRDIRSKNGTWGILTRDLVSRQDSFVTALIAALAPFYNSGAYKAAPQEAEPATTTISMKSEAL